MNSRHTPGRSNVPAFYCGKGFPLNKGVFFPALFIVIAVSIVQIGFPSKCGGDGSVKLPEPVYDGRLSLERATLERRSIREFRDDSIKLADISQLLWAAQGISSREGYRTVPSAGALYPLEIFILAGNVDGLGIGTYRYRPQSHELIKTADGDRRSELSNAALWQSSIKRAPAVLVISAVFERTARKYGERAFRYVCMESGNASQNVSLEAVSLGLGTVIIGAFNDSAVKKLMGLDSEEPLIIMPVGRPAS